MKRGRERVEISAKEVQRENEKYQNKVFSNIAGLNSKAEVNADLLLSPEIILVSALKWIKVSLPENSLPRFAGAKSD